MDKFHWKKKKIDKEQTTPGILHKDLLWKDPNDCEKILKTLKPFQQALVKTNGVERRSAPLKLEPYKPNLKFGCIVERNFETLEHFQKRTGILIPVYFGLKHARLVPEVVESDLSKVYDSHFGYDGEGDLYYIPRNGQLRRICNFHIQITEKMEVTDRDGNKERYIVTHVPNFDYDATTLESEFSNIMQYYIDTYPALYVPSDFKSPPKQYFQEYAASIFPQKQGYREIYLYHGWEQVDYKMVYLSTDPEFDSTQKGKDDKTKYKVHLPDLSSMNICDIWQIGQKILSIGGNGKNALRAILPIFLYLHLGFAAKLYEDAGQPIQFILMITGPSGSLKTAICKAIAEPFNPDGMLNFQSTDRAIELYRKQSIDMTMIVDDIFSIYDKATASKFNRILRAFGDGIGRAKAINTNSDGNFNGTERILVRGGCIVTGEHGLNAQQSTNLRTVQIEVERDTFDKSVLSEFQNNIKNAKRYDKESWVQLYFTGWIRYLENHYNEIVDIIENYQPEDMVHFQFKRHESNFNSFCTVISLIISWGIEAGALTEEQGKALSTEWKNVVLQMMKANEEYAKFSEPYEQFLKALEQGIGTGTIRIAANRQEYEVCNGHFVGYEDTGARHLILAPDPTIMAVRRWLESKGQVLVADNLSICRALYRNHITDGYSNQSDGKGHYRERYFKRIMLNGRSTEMLVINVSAMEKLTKES